MADRLIELGFVITQCVQLNNNGWFLSNVHTITILNKKVMMMSMGRDIHIEYSKQFK